MVLKPKDTIRRDCVEYYSGANDITQLFMAIRKTMHALLNEPLSAGSGMHSTSILDIN